ncbi:MAG: glutamate--tRNA ligase family protein [Myxococcota bacterium]
MGVGRFAPSPTGDAHPGTLLAGLLAWLDAKSRRDGVLLRLEDLDTTRVQSAYTEAILEALDWLGLRFDAVHVQSRDNARHTAALDALAREGVLYPCSCSRSRIKTQGRKAPDGGFAYDNTCRGRPLPAGGWRASKENLRARLPDEALHLVDESGLDLSQTPATDMGDPVVFRKDGVVAYQLAVVVDDAAQAVTRVVRGRDIAPSTATQVMLQRLLGLPTPTYRHHFLLLEPQGDKLAKLHGSVGWRELARHYDGPTFCGLLARLAGLTREPSATTPAELLAGFTWSRVADDDVVVRWSGHALEG